MTKKDDQEWNGFIPDVHPTVALQLLQKKVEEMEERMDEMEKQLIMATGKHRVEYWEDRL